MLNLQKLTTSFMLALAIAVTQIGAVAAQDITTPLTGTVQTITLETDATTSVTTVVVTYDDGTGAIQTVRLSVETATSLGLVTTDSTTGTPVVVVNDPAVGQPVTIDPTTVISNPTDGTTETEHPVGSKLSDFFSELLGVSYDDIMSAHNDGTGFGVIAQALWMTNKLGGDTTTFQAIIEAKKTGDYSGITLSDGSTSTATTWGQFRKEGTDKGDKGNLGSVMSGRANNGQTQDDTTTLSESTNGNSGALGNNGKTQDGTTTLNEAANDDNGNQDSNGKSGNNGKGNGRGKP
jgi:hypothetical protein